MLKSLLSTFTHITYKEVLSRGFFCVQINSVLKSLLSTLLKGHMNGDFAVLRSNLSVKVIAEYLYSYYI